MLNLDLTTLVVVLVALNAVIGAALAFTTSPTHGSGALWHWSLALLAVAGACLALVVRNMVPFVVSVMLGNVLLIYALERVGEVASALVDRSLDRRLRRMFTIITAPVLGLLYFTADEVWPRTLYMAVVEGWIVGQLAWQMREARAFHLQRPHPSVLAFEGILWVLFAEQCVRAIVVVVHTPDELMGGSTLVSTGFLIAILLVVIGTFVLVWNELEVKRNALDHAMTTDPESGLPNRVLFFRELETWLASRNGAGRESGTAKGIGAAALVQVKPLKIDGLSVDPYQEGYVLGSVGVALSRYLGPSDLIARVSLDKFALLFRSGEVERLDAMMKRLLADLQTRGVPVEGGRCLVEVQASLIACDTSVTSAAEVLRLLHAGLAGVTVEEVQVLRYAA